MRNIGYCQYTYRHRKALLYYIQKNQYLTEEDKKEMLNRARFHDLDKMTLYLFWEKDPSSNYHRHHNAHHLTEYEGTEIGYYDRMEAVFDFECAALTKWDKPLNAFDTMNKWYPECREELMPILQKLHMDSSYIAIDDEAKAYISQFDDVTEEMILKEVAMYLNEKENNVYDVLGDAICTKEEYEKLKSFM